MGCDLAAARLLGFRRTGFMLGGDTITTVDAKNGLTKGRGSMSIADWVARFSWPSSRRRYGATCSGGKSQAEAWSGTVEERVRRLKFAAEESRLLNTLVAGKTAGACCSCRHVLSAFSCTGRREMNAFLCGGGDCQGLPLLRR